MPTPVEVASAAFAEAQAKGAFTQTQPATPAAPAYIAANEAKEQRHKREGHAKD